MGFSDLLAKRYEWLVAPAALLLGTYIVKRFRLSAKPATIGAVVMLGVVGFLFVMASAGSFDWRAIRASAERAVPVLGLALWTVIAFRYWLSVRTRFMALDAELALTKSDLVTVRGELAETKTAADNGRKAGLDALKAVKVTRGSLPTDADWNWIDTDVPYGSVIKLNDAIVNLRKELEAKRLISAPDPITPEDENRTTEEAQRDFDEAMTKKFPSS